MSKYVSYESWEKDVFKIPYLSDLEILVTIKKSYLEVLYPQCIEHIWLTSKFFVLEIVFINLKKFYIDSGT